MSEEMVGEIGDQCETGAGYFESRLQDGISHPRRLQLLRLAEKIAAEILEQTKPHERHLVRRMTDILLPHKH